MQQQLLNSLGEYQLAGASTTGTKNMFCRFGSESRFSATPKTLPVP
jgi:hypothetical protein